MRGLPAVEMTETMAMCGEAADGGEERTAGGGMTDTVAMCGEAADGGDERTAGGGFMKPQAEGMGY